ncbi:DUF938 domain-containing protein [Roseomonas sp. WA12]
MGENPAQPWLPAEASGGVRKHAPATLRNRDAIVAALRNWLPPQGLVLEIASGSGEHIAHFATLFPNLRWQPSDPDPHALASIEAWRRGSDAPNLLAPRFIDAAAAAWDVEAVDAVLCINMSHIAPWSATLGLIAGARRILATGEPLIIYGPFTQADAVTAPSNAAFDRTLRQRDQEWGLRAVEDVVKACQQSGFGAADIVSMPANNLSLMFRVA